MEKRTGCDHVVFIHSFSNPCYQEIKVLHEESIFSRLSRLKQNDALRLFKSANLACSFLPFIADGPPSSPGIMYLEVQGQLRNGVASMFNN